MVRLIRFYTLDFRRCIKIMSDSLKNKIEETSAPVQLPAAEEAPASPIAPVAE